MPVPPRPCGLCRPCRRGSALAAVAWAVTVMRARTMGNGPGTMGLALLPFLGLWLVMMAAMMLPSVAIGVLAIWFPWLLPGLHVSAMPAM